MTEAENNSECLGYLLKFPKIDHIETLIDTALSLKARYLHKKEEPRVERSTDSSSVTTSLGVSKKNANWIQNSINFFGTKQQLMKVPSEEKKSVKTISEDVKPVRKTVLEKLATCIATLRKESSRYLKEML